MKVKSESEAAQSYLTLNDPMDGSLPGSSVHRIFQARVLEWGVIAFSYSRHNGNIKAIRIIEKSLFLRYTEKRDIHTEVMSSRSI